MRKLFILFSFLSIGLSASAQNYYAVRIGSFVDVRPQDFDAIRPFGFVYATQAATNLYDIQIGAYEDRITAEKVLIEVKRKGYVNANVVERSPSEGVSLTVIQLGVSNVGKPIDWERFMKAGEPYIIIGGENLKITTGAFPDMQTAREWLTRIKKAGFADAFIRSVNSIFLHKAGDFETGIKKPLIPLVFEENKTVRPRPATPRTSSPAIPSDTRSATTQVPQTEPYGKEAPRSYEENSGWTVKSPQTPVIVSKGAVEQRSTPQMVSAPTTTATPKIRGNVKRRSALELQRVLKAEETYKSDLDGYYGPGTAAAYQASLENNRLIQKYTLLARHAANNSKDQLQLAINNLLSDALAPSVIETSKEPVALAYKAYLLFRNYGPDKQINALMNNALRGAYSGKKMKGRTPFDYNATYAYEDINQLILHIYYVHSAPGNHYAAPCWLNEQHPAESATAQSVIASYADAGFVLQACDQFSTWDEVRMLKAIAADLNAGDLPSGAVLSAAAARRSQLYLAPKVLTAAQEKEVETWNAKTWIGLNGWATRDPLNEQMVTAFKIMFFNSQVLLEDYFMDRGIEAEAAKGLALATLQTLVAPYVERFV